jgi:hypothetical protein
MTSFGRRWLDNVPVALCAAVVVLALGAASAQASLSPAGSFGGSGSGDGQFATPQGVAIDQSSGAVYVTDGGNARVEKFDSAGTFALTWGWGVADGTAVAQTCASSCQTGIAGSGTGQFANPSTIAVDNSTGGSAGDVYVGDATNHVVQKFDSAGTYLATITGSDAPQGAFTGNPLVSVDQDGNLWVADSGHNNVMAFADTGAYVTGSQFSDTYGATLAIAVDSTNNRLYLIRGSGATEVWTLAGGGETVVNGSGGTAISVEPSTGNLYLANGQISVYDPSGNSIDPSPLTGVGHASGLAFGTTAAQLYVTDSTNNDVALFAPPTPGAPVVNGESSSNVTPAGATLHALVNPVGNDTSCVFEYVDDAEFQANGYTNAQSAPCTPASLGSGFTDVNASAVLSGLQPSTTYHYHAIATNADGSDTGADQTFTTAAVPVVESVNVVNITTTTVGLRAMINPNGSPASYQFQYGTDTNYTGGTVPASPQALGGGNTPRPARADLSGLQPNTTYHFRVLLDGSIPDADHTFTTLAPVGGSSAGAPGLPDGRAYELITPTDKNGATVLGGLVSTDGNGVAYYALGSIPGGNSSTQVTYLRAKRTPQGWTSTDITPPPSNVPAGTLLTQGPMFTTDDLGTTVWSTLLPYDPGDQDVDVLRNFRDGHSDLYSSTGPGDMQWLSQGPGATNPPDHAFEVTFDGASADASHVVFSTGEALTDVAAATPITPDSTGSYGQYLYDRTGGETHLVNVADDGSLLNDKGAILGHGWFLGGGSLSPNIYAVTTNAISDDGSKIFFESPPPTPFGTQQLMSHLWVRKDNTTTVQIDSPAATDPAQSATFEGASADGSKAFFTTTQQLTGDDTDTAKDLYMFDTASGQNTRVTKGAANPAGSQFVGVVAIANDGSHIWFVADSALANGASDGSNNLYVYDTATDTTTYVATLADSDVDGPCDGCGSSLVDAADFSRPGIPTPDGKYLVFASQADLTGTNGSGFGEIYRYTTADNSLVCISCVNGVAHRGSASLSGVGGSYRPVGQPTSVTADGSKIFFNTPDSLVPADINDATAPNVNRSTDVYEWQNGQVSMITSGRSNRASGLSGVTPDGNNVIIQTFDRLVPQDTDSEIDIYDVRVGGGIPAPPAPPPPCDDSSCHTAGSQSTPFFPAPSSQTFVGPGNVVETLKKQALKVRSISAAQKKRLAKTGKLTLTVDVTKTGRLTAKITGSLKKGAKAVTLASASKQVTKPGTVRLTLTLSKKARSALKKRGKLPLTIRVAIPGANTQIAHLTVNAPKTGKGA